MFVPTVVAKAYCRRVYSLCLGNIKNPVEAQDLTQQVFLQLFRKISTFRAESGFSTWLHRVTVNIVLMHMRRKKPAEVLAEDLDGHTSNGESSSECSSDDPSMFGVIERLNLMRAIRKLPSGYKQVFLLRTGVASVGKCTVTLMVVECEIGKLIHGEACCNHLRPRC